MATVAVKAIQQWTESNVGDSNLIQNLLFGEIEHHANAKAKCECKFDHL